MSGEFNIEAGKRYYRADGGVSGLIERTGDNGAYEFTDGTRYYDRCGFLYSAKEPSKVDLIREYKTIKYGTDNSDVIIKRLRDQQTKFMTPILGEAADALAAFEAFERPECCDGRECGCRASTPRDWYEWHLNEAENKLKWKPIDTAPKDGTRILVCQSLNRLIRVAEWSSQYEHWATSSGPMAFIAMVTHWMHLPDTPNP